jgi:hypothetical protein
LLPARPGSLVPLITAIPGGVLSPALTFGMDHKSLFGRLTPAWSWDCNPVLCRADRG